MRNRSVLAGAAALALLLTVPTLAQEGNSAYLGVYLTGLSNPIRTALGLEEGEGILIENVVRDQAADKAGLQSGDVLLELGGRSIHSSSSLGRALDRAGAGKTVDVVILREGKRRTLEVTLGDRSRRGWTVWAPEVSGVLAAPDAPDAPALYAPLASVGGLWSLGDPSRRLGLRTTELTGQLAEYFDVARGLLVTWVVPDSPAGRAGVKAGDILVSLGGQPIAGNEDLTFVLGSSKQDEELVLDVVRHGKKEALKLRL